MRTPTLTALVLVLSALSTVACQNCNPVGAASGVEVRLAQIVANHGAVKVHACYGRVCVDADEAGNATSGGSPAVLIPLPQSPGPAQTLSVKAIDSTTGQVLVDANAPLDIPVRKTGPGGCSVDSRFIAVTVTGDGKLQQVR
ncbi:hypothetical protein ACNTMW_25055 [Planosporangium sp. 12N6]|uniref:hypothetical protein n=1 Tax=Planosporangium spinosum TaxID=3402278 RepID=UPI003CE7D218